MKSALFVLLFLLSFDVVAQSTSGDVGVVTSSRRYERVSGDSLYLRRDRASRDEGNDSGSERPVARPRARARRAQSDGQRVDSLSYTARQYAFGERVIMRGDSGKDVRKLAEILVNNLYVDERALLYNEAGEVVYDGELLQGVIRFQRLNGHYPDGIVGRELIRIFKRL